MAQQAEPSIPGINARGGLQLQEDRFTRILVAGLHYTILILLRSSANNSHPPALKRSGTHSDLQENEEYASQGDCLTSNNQSALSKAPKKELA